MKTGWRTVQLGEICTFNYGKALPESARNGGNTPVFGSNGVVGSHDSSITYGRTIVIGRKGSFGEVNFSAVPSWPIDTAYFVDEKSTDQDIRWLYYRLGSLGLNQMNKAAAVPGLNRDDAYRKQLLLPPLPEQRRIAAILDKADALRTKRREALAQLDRLAQSIFVEMFGDPLTNPKGWPESTTLGEVADIVSGVTKGRKLEGKITREVPYLAVANVQDMRLSLENVKRIEATEDEIRRYALREGDLLLTEGGDPDKLGRGTLWHQELPECIHQNHVFRVRLTASSLTPYFLNWLVGSQRGKRYFLKSAKQTTGIASINMTQLRGFPLLMPPLALQREFEKVVGALKGSRHRMNAAASSGESLFAAIQRRAFRGEL